MPDCSGKNFYYHSCPVFLLSVFITLACRWNLSAQKDYPAEFGVNWIKAEAFIDENKQWIKPLLKQYDIDFYEAMAIVFPELIRYSALRDRIEITLLKALYVSLGNEYADFSIGPFQMKPSFAMSLLDAADRTGLPVIKELSEHDRGKKDSWRYRSSIVNDLENIHAQLLYLIDFIKTCELKFELLKTGDTSRIAFLATAYNAGFWKTRSEISGFQTKKYFTTRLSGPPYYSYSDIAVYWYMVKKSELQ